VGDMALWNTWLCRNQLRHEVLTATLNCASRFGWIANVESERITGISNTPTVSVYRDPTMPQFRPNSSADVDTTGSLTNDTDIAGPTNGSHVFHADEFALYPDEDETVSDPKGPFFVRASSNIDTSSSMDHEDTVHEGSATTVQAAASSSLSLSNIEVLEDGPPGPSQDDLNKEYSIANWRNYTDNSMLHILHIDCTDGIEQLRASAKPVIHSTNPFHLGHDQLRPLYRHVRELAMDPTASSHMVFLASLEAVQQEIQERRGSGMINLEEFDEHMQDNNLRFLESWMEWVSI
jgi:hypothetical protein